MRRLAAILAFFLSCAGLAQTGPHPAFRLELPPSSGTATPDSRSPVRLAALFGLYGRVNEMARPAFAPPAGYTLVVYGRDSQSRFEPSGDAVVISLDFVNGFGQVTPFERNPGAVVHEYGHLFFATWMAGKLNEWDRGLAALRAAALPGNPPQDLPEDAQHFAWAHNELFADLTAVLFTGDGKAIYSIISEEGGNPLFDTHPRDFTWDHEATGWSEGDAHLLYDPVRSWIWKKAGDRGITRERGAAGLLACALAGIAADLDAELERKELGLSPEKANQTLMAALDRSCSQSLVF